MPSSVEPVRTPSFDAAAVPTVLLVVIVAMSIAAGWTLPGAGVAPLGAGILLGCLYTALTDFTTFLQDLSVPNSWLRSGVAVGVVVLLFVADEATSLPDWSVLVFTVGLLIALAASRWWLLLRWNESSPSHDRSRSN